MATFNYADLMKAIKENQTARVKLLCQTPGFDINWENGKLLEQASRFGCVEIVRHFFTVPSLDVNSNQSGVTPLHWACQNGHSEVVAVLLRHLNLGVNKFTHHSTPLQLAIHAAHVMVVKRLLENDNIEVNSELVQEARQVASTEACLVGASQADREQRKKNLLQIVEFLEKKLAEVTPPRQRPRPDASENSSSKRQRTSVDTPPEMTTKSAQTTALTGGPVPSNPWPTHHECAHSVCCYECKALICHYCIPEQHSGHHFESAITINNKVNELENSISAARVRAQEVAAALEKRAQENAITKKAISAHYDSLTAQLDERRQKMLREIDQQQGDCDSKKGLAQQTATRLTFTFSAAGLEAQRSFKDKLEYYNKAKKAAAGLDQLMVQVPQPPPATRCQWKAGDAEPLKKFIAESGTLTFK